MKHRERERERERSDREREREREWKRGPEGEREIEKDRGILRYLTFVLLCVLIKALEKMERYREGHKER